MKKGIGALGLLLFQVFRDADVLGAVVTVVRKLFAGLILLLGAFGYYEYFTVIHFSLVEWEG
jgi:hypothetical protein